MSHHCPIPGCTWTVADDKLMCLGHWKLVPNFARRQVTVAWNVLRMAREPKKRLDAVLRYREARDSAIAAVQHLGPLL